MYNLENHFDYDADFFYEEDKDKNKDRSLINKASLP